MVAALYFFDILSPDSVCTPPMLLHLPSIHFINILERALKMPPVIEGISLPVRVFV
jgi:hypothetical protein